MDEYEKFYFDLTGFLVIRNAVPATDVERALCGLQECQEQVIEEERAGAGYPMFEGTLPRRALLNLLELPGGHSTIFRELLASPALIPYLNTLLGPGWRLDHLPKAYLTEVGAEGFVLHGPGHAEFDSAQYYTFNNGYLRCGMVGVLFALSPVRPGDGGFVCLPGSHKANLPVPLDVRGGHRGEELLQNPALDPGDALLFTESLVHGTLPWKSEIDRRVLLYRFSPRSQHMWAGVHGITMPEWVAECTPAVQAVLAPPFSYFRSVLRDDGTVEVQNEPQ